MINLELYNDEFFEDCIREAENFGWTTYLGIDQIINYLAKLRDLFDELRTYEDEGLISALPKLKQDEVDQRISAVISELNQAKGGSPQKIVQVGEAIEALELGAWSLNLRFLSKGFFKPVTRLKDIERVSKKFLEAEKVWSDTQEFARIRKEEAENWAQQSQLGTELINQLKQNNESFLTLAETIRKNVNATSNERENAENTANQIKQELVKAEAAVATAEANRKILSQFMERIAESESRMNSIYESTKEFSTARSSEVDNFVKNRTTELLDLENQMKKTQETIDIILQKATSAKHFEQFEARKNAIKGDEMWLKIALGTSALTLVAAGWLVHGLGSTTPEVLFFVKLSLTLPGFFIVGYALKQYNKERRLKEEYAFKSVISLSLESYRRLVDKAVEELDPAQRGPYIEFLIKSVGSIFESPTEKVFAERKFLAPSDSKIFATVLKQAQDIKELIKP